VMLADVCQSSSHHARPCTARRWPQTVHDPAGDYRSAVRALPTSWRVPGLPRRRCGQWLRQYWRAGAPWGEREALWAIII
jgi:hypothetical protein